MPTISIIGYVLSISETARLLETRGLIESIAADKDRARKEVFCYRETHGYDSADITEDDVILKLLEKREYSETFYNHLSNGLVFNGVKCDVEYIDIELSTYIGKVLGYDDVGYISFSPDKVAEYAKDLRNLDPIFQDQEPIVHVLSY